MVAITNMMGRTFELTEKIIIETKDGKMMYARQLMTENGLGRDWKIKIGSAKRQAGSCHRGLKVIRLSHTLLSQWPFADIRDTILHEIAHALTPNDPGHGAAWKAKCIEIGAKPERCYESGALASAPKSWIQSCSCRDDRGQIHRRTRGAVFSGCRHEALYRRIGEPASAAKPFRRETVKGTTAWAMIEAVKLGAKYNGGYVDAPKGKIWASTETHGIDLSSEYYRQSWDQTAAEGRKNLVSDITSGFADCYPSCYCLEEG